MDATSLNEATQTRRGAALWNDAGMFIVCVVVFVLCSLFVPNFFTWVNAKGLALAVSTTGMVACTMLFCLASGHFDLCVGSVVACSGVLGAEPY